MIVHVIPPKVEEAEEEEGAEAEGEAGAEEEAAKEKAEGPREARETRTAAWIVLSSRRVGPKG